MTEHQEEAEEHCEECDVRSISSRWPCTCEQIDREDAIWRAEPADMFAREWGCY